ncbi:MAG: AfsR/SARP family transcriptional regulator [Atopobiaceae bacterium]|jgi:two-component SAPR family response regulator
MAKSGNVYIDALVGKRTTMSKKISKRSTYGRYEPSDVASSLARIAQEEDASGSRLFALIAEPGMDADHVLRYIALSCEGSKVNVLSTDLGHRYSEECLSDFYRFGRNVVKSCLRTQTVAICHNMPAADESQLEKLVAVLHKMMDTGALVFLSMYPEASQLVEEFPQAVCYKTHDLLVSLPRKLTRTRAMGMQMRSLTHCIPALVRVIASNRYRRQDATPFDDGYRDSISQLVKESLRGTLMAEERELRLAMLLLGEGNFVDLQYLMRRIDYELLASMEDSVPLLGIDVGCRSFSCACANTTEGLSLMYASILPVAAEFPNTVVGIVDVLVRREDWARAAQVASMCDDQARAISAVLKYAAQFVNIGEAGLVSDVLEHSAACGLASSEDAKRARAGLKLLYNVGDELMNPFATCWDPDEGTEPGWNEYLGAIRAISRGIGLDAPIPLPYGGSNFVFALAHFAEAFRLTMLGEYADAFGQILLARTRHSETPGSLLEMLIADLYYVLSGLTGALPTPNELTWWQQAHDKVQLWCPAILEKLHRNIPAIVSIMMGTDVDTGEVAELVHALERKDEHMLSAWFMLVACISDVRRGTFSRAQVRLTQMRRVLEAMHNPSPYLDASAALLEALLAQKNVQAVQALLNEGVLPQEFATVAQLVVQASARKKDDAEPLGGLEPHVPAGTVWILNLSVDNFGALSELCLKAIPESWRDELARIALQVARSDGADEMSEINQVEALSCNLDEETGHARIEISILGRVRVRYLGQEIPEAMIDRRRAKELLVLLASAEAHELKRYKIMESIWPDADYVSGQQRLYEATSVLRTLFSKCLYGETGSLDREAAVIANRSTRTLALNPACVSVDVDRFLALARSVMDREGDDAFTVAAAKKVEAIYRGDLCLPANDGIGIVELRRRELRGIYTDVMVAGTLAALRSNRILTATRFAQNAYVSDNTREDVMKLYMAAFVAAGRTSEAEREYKKYCIHVVDVTHNPPSRALRETVARLLAGGRSSAMGIVGPALEIPHDAPDASDVPDMPDAEDAETTHDTHAHDIHHTSEFKAQDGRGSVVDEPEEERPEEQADGQDQS